MNKYKVRYFNFDGHVNEWEIVEAMTAQDAHYCWETQNKNGTKHFLQIEAVKNETGTTQG